MITFEVLKAMRKNGLKRNLSILGGEPLCPQNRDFTRILSAAAKYMYPDSTIYCWTGYKLEDLDKHYLDFIDVLIDGPFIQEQRDITLPLRGSSNQRILYKGKDF